MQQKQLSALEEYDFTDLATNIGQTAATVVNATKNFASEYGPKAIDLIHKGVDATDKFMSTIKSAYSGEMSKSKKPKLKTPVLETSKDNKTPTTPQQSNTDKPNNNINIGGSFDKVIGQTLSTNALPVMRERPPVLGQQNVNNQNIKSVSNLNINQLLRLMKNASPSEQDSRMEQVVRSLGTGNIYK